MMLGFKSVMWRLETPQNNHAFLYVVVMKNQEGGYKVNADLSGSNEVSPIIEWWNLSDGTYHY